MIFTILVCFFAGMGAGIGTGFAGMSAAAVISPMLITFLGMDPYQAVGIALASDVLASAGLSLYLRQKQKPGCGKRNRDDGHGTFIYAAGQLYRKSAPEYDHGRIFDGHDTAAWCQIYRKTGYDDQRSHAGSLKKEAFYPVCDLRHADRIYLRLCRSGRRTDDASDPDKCAWL